MTLLLEKVPEILGVSTRGGTQSPRHTIVLLRGLRGLRESHCWHQGYMDAAPFHGRASGSLWQADDEDPGPSHGGPTFPDILRPGRGLDGAAQPLRQTPLARCSRVYALRLRKGRRTS